MEKIPILWIDGSAFITVIKYLKLPYEEPRLLWAHITGSASLWLIYSILFSLWCGGSSSWDKTSHLLSQDTKHNEQRAPSKGKSPITSS